MYGESGCESVYMGGGSGGFHQEEEREFHLEEGERIPCEVTARDRRQLPVRTRTRLSANSMVGPPPFDGSSGLILGSFSFVTNRPRRPRCGKVSEWPPSLPPAALPRGGGGEVLSEESGSTDLSALVFNPSPPPFPNAPPTPGALGSHPPPGRDGHVPWPVSLTDAPGKPSKYHWQTRLENYQGTPTQNPIP